MAAGCGAKEPVQPGRCQQQRGHGKGHGGRCQDTAGLVAERERHGTTAKMRVWCPEGARGVPSAVRALEPLHPLLCQGRVGERCQGRALRQHRLMPRLLSRCRAELGAVQGTQRPRT